jgi:acyl-CoA thioesterase-1
LSSRTLYDIPADPPPEALRKNSFEGATPSASEIDSIQLSLARGLLGQALISKGSRSMGKSEGLILFGDLCLVRVMWKALLCSIALALGSRAESPPQIVLCLGDSLTAGYGLSMDQAWPALVQEKLRAAGYKVELINAGQSGDTTAGGLRRLEWLLTRPVDVLVIALGANDGLRGLATGELERNLEMMIRRARAAYPNVRILLAGMRAPPNMGEDYARAFAAVYPRVAQKNGAALWPFMLEGVGGVPELNLDDGIHPNAEGQRRIAEMAFDHLRALLEQP